MCRQQGLHLPVIVALLVVMVLSACDAQALNTPAQVDQARAAWQADPVDSYHIVVQVQRPDEQRRHEVWVRGGQVVSGTLQYKDPNGRGWQEPQVVAAAQSMPYTAPGLFDMARDEMMFGNRGFVRVEMEEIPVFPRRIVIGPAYRAGQPIAGTQATVTVRVFEILTPE